MCWLSGRGERAGMVRGRWCAVSWPVWSDEQYLGMCVLMRLKWATVLPFCCLLVPPAAVG